MYLKSLEMVGFKSFAEKTKLDFESGMTAVVGPNGCGKSNISDAVRWVLGEQSAKALRGGAMTDVIFNGTDTRKPVGMAEVSLTLTDCEAALGTEYNEVTITRRVVRSGDGQYFINRTPCRLKDIQRLFMDTGIGTTSYSVLEQGRIDQILSSRPDDRRAVFEEASGITKFKADRKEALRKLDHTEANLLRLDDIIREVRRQIISLQRQAGKARRYQTMHDEMRGLDLYFTRERLTELDASIKRLETELATLREREEAVREETRDLDRQATTSREQITHLERDINTAMEAVSDARSAVERSRESMRLNQDRILELQQLADRDNRDADEAVQRLEGHRAEHKTLSGSLDEAAAERDRAKASLDTQGVALESMETSAAECTQSLHTLRAELVDLESRSASLQNELSDLEARERTHIVRSERLAAEQAEMTRAVDDFAERQAEMNQRREACARVVAQHADELARAERALAECTDSLAAARQERSSLQSKIAAREAEAGVLDQATREGDGLPGGVRLALQPGPGAAAAPVQVLGTLSQHLEVEEADRPAVEAVLRTRLDALVVEHPRAARQLAEHLADARAGSADILPASLASSSRPPRIEGAQPLAERVQCSPEVRPLVQALLEGVGLWPANRAVPDAIPSGAILVREDGMVLRGDGGTSFCMAEDPEASSLGRRVRLDSCRRELDDLRRMEAAADHTLARLTAARETAEATLQAARTGLDEARRGLNLCEGEFQVVTDEARQATERLETVQFERESLAEQNASSDARRQEIRDAVDAVRGRQDEVRGLIADQTTDLKRLEHERTALSTTVTDHRIRFAECKQRAEALEHQRQGLAERVHELESIIRSRRQGVDEYQARIQTLRRGIETATTELPPLEQTVDAHQERLGSLRRTREQALHDAAQRDVILREKREYLDEVVADRSHREVEFAEERMRRETLIERAASEYQVTIQDVVDHPDPAWDGDGRPDNETIEARIGELRAKIEAMGPVNLVAIEEHRELEERYAFLTQQQEDLVQAKQQLLDMIRHINPTTTEMFSDTFNQVNDQFQGMFKRLFGGGSARLVLVDEEDILESGIEIIARPPGKKLQSISLLSGGERTMTAVALLFSLYQVKPSAFCVLDELDAALDEANIGRFVDVVKGFLESSQFIIITHNRRTIGVADILYGVTMQERGVSDVVSVKFSDYEKEGKIPAGAKTPQGMV